MRWQTYQEVGVGLYLVTLVHGLAEVLVEERLRRFVKRADHLHQVRALLRHCKQGAPFWELSEQEDWIAESLCNSFLRPRHQLKLAKYAIVVLIIPLVGLERLEKEEFKQSLVDQIRSLRLLILIFVLVLEIDVEEDVLRQSSQQRLNLHNVLGNLGRVVLKCPQRPLAQQPRKLYLIVELDVLGNRFALGGRFALALWSLYIGNRLNE